jgi:hypothetical protein
MVSYKVEKALSLACPAKDGRGPALLNAASGGPYGGFNRVKVRVTPSP